jgi:hypothetical protein
MLRHPDLAALIVPRLSSDRTTTANGVGHPPDQASDSHSATLIAVEDQRDGLTSTKAALVRVGATIALVADTTIVDLMTAPVADTTIADLMTAPVADTTIADLMTAPVADTTIADLMTVPAADTTIVDLMTVPVADTTIVDLMTAPVADIVGRAVMQEPEIAALESALTDQAITVRDTATDPIATRLAASVDKATAIRATIATGATTSTAVTSHDPTTEVHVTMAIKPVVPQGPQVNAVVLVARRVTVARVAPMIAVALVARRVTVARVAPMIAVALVARRVTVARVAPMIAVALVAQIVSAHHATWMICAEMHLTKNVVQEAAQTAKNGIVRSDRPRSQATALERHAPIGAKAGLVAGVKEATAALHVAAEAVGQVVDPAPAPADQAAVQVVVVPDDRVGAIVLRDPHVGHVKAVTTTSGNKRDRRGAGPVS